MHSIKDWLLLYLPKNNQFNWLPLLLGEHAATQKTSSTTITINRSHLPKFVKTFRKWQRASPNSLRLYTQQFCMGVFYISQKLHSTKFFSENSHWEDHKYGDPLCLWLTYYLKLDDNYRVIIVNCVEWWCTHVSSPCLRTLSCSSSSLRKSPNSLRNLSVRFSLWRSTSVGAEFHRM